MIVNIINEPLWLSGLLANIIHVLMAGFNLQSHYLITLICYLALICLHENLAYKFNYKYQ
jgi:hypothetical protein